MKILVTGSTGTLGMAVCDAARHFGYTYCAGTHCCLDITQQQQIERCLDKFKPDAVINCAGIIRGKVSSPFHLNQVNAYGAHLLGSECRKRDVRMVHISTDCVFNNVLPEGKYGWLETDTPTPIDMYSISKLAGEVQDYPHLTVRSSFIGFGKIGLLHWLMNNKFDVPGYAEALWNGLTAPYLATCLMSLANKRNINGLLHIGCEDKISKYELLQTLVELFKLSIKVHLAPTPVPHRFDRTLDTINHNIRSTFKIPCIEQQIAELAAE